MHVQALCSELGVERFDKGVVGRFVRACKVERDAVAAGPLVHVPRDKLAAVIHPYRHRIANLLARHCQLVCGF